MGMEQERGNTASRKGKHLNRNERVLMEGFLRAGMTRSEIALPSKPLDEYDTVVKVNLK